MAAQKAEGQLKGPESKSETPARKVPAILESLHAPEVFASALNGVSRRMGNVHMTFLSDRYNHSTNEGGFVVIGRLVMPIEGAQDMLVLLYKFFKDMGLDPLASPPKDKVQ